MRALDAAAELEKAPAGELAHVLLRQAGERGDDAQRAVRRARRSRSRTARPASGASIVADQFGERAPGIGREAVADHRCGRLRAPATRYGSEPSQSRGCSAARATSAGLTSGMSLGPALPGSEQRDDPRDDRGRGLAGLGGAVDQRAHQPQRRLGALDVAADPEQIVGGAARQRAGGALDGDALRRRQQRGLGHRPVRQHPGIGGAPALLQADGARVGVVGDAHEAARHDRPAVADARQKQPQDERPRLEPAVAPDRHGRQRHRLLRDEVDAAVGDRLARGARALIGVEAWRRARLRRCCGPAGRRRTPTRSPSRRACPPSRRAPRDRRATRSRHWESRARCRAGPAPAPAGRPASRAPRPRRSRARWRSRPCRRAPPAPGRARRAASAR